MKYILILILLILLTRCAVQDTHAPNQHVYIVKYWTGSVTGMESIVTDSIYTNTGNCVVYHNIVWNTQSSICSVSITITKIN